MHAATRPRRHRTGGVAAVGVVLLALLATLLPGSTAGAVTTAGWATWEPLGGSAGQWTTRMQLPAGGFPGATVTSDSRGGQVGVQSGTSAWLGSSTPPGTVFGSSQGEPYLNLRPRADSPSAPSTTTYTFDRPTPAGGWAYELGDIDADRAVVIARGTDGGLLTGAELGWQGGFNYCVGTGTPSCPGVETDVATWDPVTGEVIGNAAGVDTSGAAGWFRPSVPITSLTVFFFQRSGFPVYQTWFASLARDITGTVDLVEQDGTAAGVVPGATLTLLGPDGSVLATTTSGADGTYTFAGYTAAPVYSVELTTLPTGGDFPAGLVPFGDRTATGVDLTTTDATDVDLAAREIVPVPVSGTVTTPDGEPVPGATVVLTGTDGVERSATTNSLGEYVVDDVPVGEHAFTVLPPDGYTVVSVPDPIDVPAGTEEPIVGQDAVVRAPATVAGSVLAGDAPVPGAVVELVDTAGTVVATVPTAADGTYTFDAVAAGDWSVRIEVPFGYTADGPVERAVEIGADDVTGVDFALARPGAIGGVVLDDAGAPVAGASVTVSGPGGDVTVVTDDAGTYLVDDLPPGEHTATLTVPAGYTTPDADRTVTLTTAGENVLDQDFTLTADVAEPSPEPSPSAAPSSSPAPSSNPEPSPSSTPPGSPEPTVDPTADPTAGPGGGSPDAPVPPGAPGAPGPGGTPELATTGADVAVVLAVAGLLLLTGAGLLLGRRRVAQR
jgi:LPXTG-motif cell wall-anchored protein